MSDPHLVVASWWRAIKCRQRRLLLEATKVLLLNRQILSLLGKLFLLFGPNLLRLGLDNVGQTRLDLATAVLRERFGTNEVPHVAGIEEGGNDETDHRNEPNYQSKSH
jgi:hypothetical protein